MSKKEKVNQVLALLNDIVDIGRLWGKAEAYEYMVDLFKKSRFKTSNPELVLNTLCLCLDSASDALEKAEKFAKDTSRTVAHQINILIETLSTLSDNVKIAVSEKKYDEAFAHVKRVKREMKSFVKKNEETFQVFMEVQRKRLEDML